MSECKVKLSVDICGESALDAVTKLVVGGMSVNKACKQVAEDFNTTNEGASVKVETLRKAYNRAQKVGTCPNSTDEKLVHVPTKKKLVPLDVPMVDNSTTNDCVIDTTKYITIEEHKAILEKVIFEFEEVIKTLSDSKQEVIETESVVEKPNAKSIPRSKVFDFIKSRGNELQVLVLKDEDLSNEKLFRVFVKVREQYKASTPPPAWDKEIVDAEFIQ